MKMKRCVGWVDSEDEKGEEKQFERDADVVSFFSQPRLKKNNSKKNPQIEFGYTRKDVLLIGAGVFALGYAMYYGLQAAGVEQGMAGNYVQLIIFCALCFGWVGSYLWRVASKNMSYAKQLEQYEEAVMAKRLEEMPEAERARLLAEAEEESAAAAAKGGGR